MEPEEWEASLVAEMLNAMERPPGEPQVEPVDVAIDGHYPASQFVVRFRCHKKPNVTFGYRVPIWAPDGPLDDLGTERFATFVWLDVHETVMTALGMPSNPGADSTTWIRTDL